MIEAANKRLSEVHSKKSTEASKSAESVVKSKKATKDAVKAAEKEENDEVSAIVKKHAKAVIKK